MNSRATVALGIFCTFLFFAGYTFYVFHLDTTFSNIDLVCSTPSPIKPDGEQDLAVTALHRGSLRPAAGLQLELVVRLSPPSRSLLGRFPLVERKAGIYSSRFQLPAMTREGDLAFSICPAGRPTRVLCGFSKPLAQRPVLAAIPPQSAVHAGDSLRIHVGMLDRETGRAIPHFPLRGLLTSPDGVEIANRLFSLNSSGSGIFRFRLHTLGPTGIWTLTFMAGDARLRLALPVYPALPLSIRWNNSLHRWLAEAGNQWVPLQWRSWLIPEAPAQEAWTLSKVTPSQPATSALTLHTSSRHLRVRIDKSARKKTAILEMWKGGHLAGTQLIKPSRKSGFISFPLPTQESRPIRFVLWSRQGKRLRILGEERWVFLSRTPEARLRRFHEGLEPFFRLAAAAPIRGSSEATLSQLFSSPDGFLKLFRVSLRPHLLMSHLERIAKAILILFPLAFAAGLSVILWTLPRAIPASTAAHSTLRHYLAVSIVLYGFYLFGLQTSRQVGIPISFLILLGFVFLARQWFIDDTLRSYTRLSGSFALLGLYMALLMLLGQTVERLGLWDTLIPPIQLMLATSLVSVPVFFLIIGLLHLEDLPRRMYDGCASILANLFWPLTTGSFAGLVLQITTLAIFFYLILQVPQRLSIPSMTLLESDSLSPGRLAAHNQNLRTMMEFSPQSSPPPISAPPIAMALPGGGAHQRRFYLLEGRLPWHGSRIDNVRVFQSPREYLDRIISAFPASRRDFRNLCVEFLARCERFERMNEGEQSEERLRLEALLGPITHVLSSSAQPSEPLSPADLSQTHQVLERAGKIIGIDPGLRKSLPKPAPCPLPHGTGIDLTLVTADGRLESVDLFHPLRNPECFRAGGSLQMAGSRNRVPYTLRGETLVLSRGNSFRADFEFRSIEPRREEPILIEIESGSFFR